MRSRREPKAPPRSTRSLGVLAALAVVAAGSVATLVVADYEDRVRDRDLRERADLVGDGVAAELTALLETQVGGAAATAAALSVDPDLDRDAFRRYASGIEDRLPALLGVGYIRQVQTSDLQGFAASASADGASGFELQDIGAGPMHAILLYNEPAELLRPSWGVEVSSVSEAARALQRATDSGDTAVTAPVVLAVDRHLPEAHRPASYVAYAPVFAPGAPTATVQQRRDAVVGWSNVPFRAQDLLDVVRLPSGVRVVLRDGGPDGPAVAAAGPTSRGATATSVRALHSRDAQIGWDMEVTVPSSAVEPQLDRSTVTLIGGTSLTALLAVLVGLLARRSRQWAGTASRAMRTLAESEQRLRATIDAAPDLLLVVDADGTVASASPRSNDLLGTEPEELEGRHIGDVLPGISDASSMEDRAEHVLHRDDGAQVVVEVAARPVRPGDATSPSVVVVRDVTAQKRAQRQLRVRSRQLERSNQDLRAIATIAAHDLSEPLTVVGGYAGLLVQRYPVETTVDEAAVDHLHTIAAAAQRMRAMLDALLHMSSTGGRVERTAVPMAEVVQDALANIEAALTDSAAEVVVGPLPTVSGQRDLLVDLVQNLLTNALRHGTGDRPLRIEIDAARVRSRWRITVADNGNGVPPEQRRRIFQAFRRLDGDSPGLGIGLSIASRIVQLHGGRIRAGEAPGGGASFSFTLPDAGSDEPRLEVDRR